MATAVKSKMAENYVHRVATETSFEALLSSCSTLCERSFREAKGTKCPTQSLRPSKKISSFLCSIKLVSGNHKLVNHDIAQAYKVIESFL